MKPNDVKSINRRIIAAIAKDLGTSSEGAEFSRHAKSTEYSLYGKNNFIKDSAKPVEAKGK